MTDEQCVWFHTLGAKGVGVLARGPWRVKASAIDPNVPDSVYPVEISGPQILHMLAVWAQPHPTYVRAILGALDHYADYLASAPSLVIGDFNSHPRLDKKGASANHSVLKTRLENDFGLVSAYHSFSGRDPNAEAPTLYWQWKEAQPFHIDYCFIPKAWVPTIHSVGIGSYIEWAKESDHRPLSVEFGTISSDENVT